MFPIILCKKFVSNRSIQPCIEYPRNSRFQLDKFKIETLCGKRQFTITSNNTL